MLKYHAIKTCKTRGGKTPRILHEGERSDFTLQPLCPGLTEESLGCVGPCDGGEKDPMPVRNQSPVVQPVVSQYTG
jgi:hypothetical protein